MKSNPQKFVILICICLAFVSFTSLAYDVTIKSSDSDALAKAYLVKVFEQGGSITFEESTRTINLSSSESRLQKDVTIIGANLSDTAFYRGAYEAAENIKTTLTFTGSRFNISKGCAKLTMKNIKWVQVGFTSDKKHLLEVDLYNVVFDLTSAKNAFADKQVFRCLDGIKGHIKNTTFRGSGSSAIAINRSLVEGVPPVTTRGTLIVDECLFDPDIRYKKDGCAALSCDGGNDEYPIPWNHGGTVYKNSHFKDCRTSSSKGENWSMINNIYEFEYSPKDAIHVEEFSNNILIQGNTFKVIGNIKYLITLGAQQTSENIQIIDNVVELGDDNLELFITTAGAKDILIRGNEIKNPTPGKEYVSAWSCNNINITVEAGQPGLEPEHLSISTEKCGVPFANGTYTLKWGTNEYLEAYNKSVRLVQKTQQPVGDEYRWIIKAHHIMGRNNYYSFQNVANGRYLQVVKGPNASQQKSMIGQPYVLFNKKVNATTLFDFDETNRVPGFGIFNKGGKYALMAGGNERRSEIIKDGDQVVLYVVQDENSSDYGWSLEKSIVNTSMDAVSRSEIGKTFTMYPNPAGNKVTILTKQLSNIRVNTITGREVLNHPNVLGTLNLDLSNFGSGVHFVQVSDAQSSWIEKLVVK